MSKKNRNVVIVAIIIIIFVFIVIYSSSKSVLMRQIRGPTEGTANVLTADNKLAVVSRNNQIFVWQWNNLSAWPTVAKPQAQIIVPAADDKIIYNLALHPEKLVLAGLKMDKEIASLSLPYGAECKKIKMSPNGQYGAVSVLFKEGMQKDWLKLAVFKSDLNTFSTSFEFQKSNTDDFSLCDFDITNDGGFLVGAGEKNGKAWVFAVDVNSNTIKWNRTFDAYKLFTIVDISPDGKTVFVVERIRHILYLNVSTGEIIKVFEMPEYSSATHQKQNISCVAISPDGRVLAADMEPTQAVWFWDIETGEKVSTIRVNDLTVSGIAFSPDSKYLATGCLVTPEIKIWKVPQLKP